jgi:hypothetical protein
MKSIFAEAWYEHAEETNPVTTSNMPPRRRS